MPKHELYAIFTGNKGRKPDKILLSKEFFEGADIDIETRAKVIYESDTNDINNRVFFCVLFVPKVLQPVGKKAYWYSGSCFHYTTVEEEYPCG